MNKVSLLESYVSHRKLPVNYDIADKAHFEIEFEKLIEPSYFFKLPNAYITCKGVVTHNYSLVKESLYHISAKEKYGIKYLLKARLGHKVVCIEQEVALIFNEWGTGYGHWLTESLPRLFCIKRYISKDTVILLPENVNISIIDSLKLFDISHIHFIKKNTIVKAKQLIMPTLIAQTGNYNDDCMKSLNTYFRNNNIVKVSTTKEKVYLSRSKANKRKIDNENELIDLLMLYGFRILYVEDLSFEEQINIFANTNFLISIHGATLSNMMFMEKGSSVLEIRNKSDFRSLCYYSLASALDINYYYIFAEPTSKNLKNNSDLKVDINAFEKLLSSIFSK